MKRKIILALSLVAILTVLFAISVSAAEPVETWDISATENDSVTAYIYENVEKSGTYTLSISGMGDMLIWDHYNRVPWRSYCSNITSAIIENGVTRISDYMFYYHDKLTDIVIPDSVISVGAYAFYSCTAVKSITIGKSITDIGYSVFGKCYGLESIIVSEENTSYKSIDGNLYSYDGKTIIQYAIGKTNETVIIPMDVTKIGNSAFEDCRKFNTVEIPESVTDIGSRAFIHCNMLKNLIIPEGLKAIGDSAFYDCIGLTTVEIPDSVTIIGTLAFSNCYNIKSVVIGSGVTQMGNGAFEYCRSLKEIKVSDKNTSYKSINGNLYSHDGKELVQYAIGKIDKSFVVSSNVTSIGNYAFANCPYLTKVVVPRSVTSMGYSVFSYCYNLTVYCEIESKPKGWARSWNESSPSRIPVVWDYKNVVKNDVLTFKGYSFGESGAIAVGYDIDYERKAFYEELTGESLEIGVLFAGFDNLGGNQPLGENGEAIVLNVGKVIKADLTEFSYKNYDFVLTDIDDSIKDVLLVISAYIYDGEVVKYIQENGISDTVAGISYNEAKESVAQ